MGAYLSQPVRTKESSSGHCKWHRWGASEMQGWRTNMEDAHVSHSDLGEDLSDLAFFGVFDGHGGAEVAAFCREHLLEDVRRRLRLSPPGSRRSEENLAKVFTESFHQMDEMLCSPEHERELLALRQACRPGSHRPQGRTSSDTSPGGSSSSSSSSASSSGSSAPSSGDEREEGEEADGPGKPKVVSVLTDSIQSDLEQARDKGSLSKEEAKQVMMKMAMLRKLESRVPSLSPETGIADNVGCTAVCVLLSAREAVCANAGDSRAILCRKGKPVELSHDHKPNDGEEKRRIEAAGGRVQETTVGKRVHHRVNGNLNLSRAIGDLEFKKLPDAGPEQQMICSTPDIIRVPLAEDDEFIVLACDGVWDVKSNQDVCDFVGERLKQNEAIPAVVEALLDDCIADDPKKVHGLGADNMTCIVVQLRKSDRPSGYSL
mmetsp:Transcript_7766/g.13781  ORF Transcript_7766/g.13781 Transcript_7766/m.13781 type:complete len:432 (+) Transcript_7766:24-1319(+)